MSLNSYILGNIHFFNFLINLFEYLNSNKHYLHVLTINTTV